MNLKIQLGHLRAFRAIMNTGSISAATDVVNLSQPAISRMLANLEAELGFKLFYRRGRGLVPTREGTAFYARIEGTLSGIDDIPIIANDIATNTTGRLRICAIGPLFYSTYLPSAIEAFRRDFPDARMTLDMRRREDIEEWVASRQVDVAFTLAPIESKSIAWKPLLTVSAVAVVPASHHLARRDAVSLQDLQGETLILPKENVRLRHFIDAQARADGVTMRVDIETSTAVTSCHMIAQGSAVGIADPFSASGIDRDRVRMLRLEPEILMEYVSIWPVDRDLSDQCEAVLNQLEAASHTFFKRYPAAKPIHAKPG